MEENLEAWKVVWRRGIAPQLSVSALRRLRFALVHDLPELRQGCTTSPPPLQCTMDWEVEAACGLAYLGWKDCGRYRVWEVEEFFARTCFEADRRLGEPAACRWFLNFFDDTPRDEMRRQLLTEVDRSLEERMPNYLFELQHQHQENAR